MITPNMIVSIILVIGGTIGFIYFGKDVPFDIENGVEWELIYENIQPLFRQVASLTLAIIGIVTLVVGFTRK